MLQVNRLLRWALPAAVLVLCATASASAQESAMPGAALAQQSLRPYAHVFLAYAIAWVFVLGWVISVSRRMGGLARRLDSQ